MSRRAGGIAKGRKRAISVALALFARARARPPNDKTLLNPGQSIYVAAYCRVHARVDAFSILEIGFGLALQCAAPLRKMDRRSSRFRSKGNLRETALVCLSFADFAFEFRARVTPST